MGNICTTDESSEGALPSAVAHSVTSEDSACAQGDLRRVRSSIVHRLFGALFKWRI